ncbi:MAG TPA: penicillin-binding protein 2 [Candidatus Paceibacterota bacterium]|jgi:cell division protein FtsI/penicillin-binding protein 2|nr:penicillin-binding protein 2 [Candidatus Paceibacterota bacterium]
MAAVTFLGALIVVRLFYLQIIHVGDYRQRAERQYVTPSTNIFDRGTIYFTSKDGTTVAAATVQDGFKAAVRPSEVVDPQKAFDEINAIIPVDQASFLASVAKKQDPYEEVAQHLSPDQGAALSADKIPGLTLYADKWRYYPGGSLAAKAIGFVSFKGNNLVGNYGLEQYYNDVLSRSNSQFYVNFFAEIFANIQSSIFKNNTSTGDVVTSIEPTVQAQLEQTVAGIQQKWSSQSVGAIVMDPYTGEIIAMAQVPSFDLNNYSGQSDVGIYSNPLVQSDFEMGSIIKPLIMGAAIENHVVTPQTTYNDQGFVVVNNAKISNFDKVGRGPGTTMQTVLNDSLNTGMIYVEQHMGNALFKQYIDKYELGQKTGIDLPGEVSGLMSSLKGNNNVNFATAAFGQGIATTPISIVRSWSLLANGGYLVTPHLATAIDQEDGTVKTLTYPKSPEPLLSPQTLATMTTMLTHVVDDGYHRGQAHYTVAAKTGTAQIAMPGGAGYYNDRNLHSMIGFFPATNPRFMLYFYNYYPKNILYSIQTLGDPFFNMIQFLENYYSIPPDR